MKLRKLRALRGNSDSGMQRQLQMPASVSADLDSIRVLFTDKEKELTLAVRKVDDLTHQLEDLRNGRVSIKNFINWHFSAIVLSLSTWSIVVVRKH